MTDTLKVNEIFLSMMGESTFAGMPAAIVRLAGCNLRCSYCDKRSVYEKGIEMTVEQVVRTVEKYEMTPVLITGGEPLLQETTHELIERLADLSHIVMIQTNGSFPISEIPNEIVTLLNFKCPGSGESDKMLLDNLDYVEEPDNLRFEITNKEDYEWAKDIIYDYDLEEACSLLISPAPGGPQPATVAEWMMEDGIMARLSLPIHKIIWGPDHR